MLWNLATFFKIKCRKRSPRVTPESESEPELIKSKVTELCNFQREELKVVNIPSYRARTTPNQTRTEALDDIFPQIQRGGHTPHQLLPESNMSNRYLQEESLQVQDIDSMGPSSSEMRIGLISSFDFSSRSNMQNISSINVD